MFKLNSITLDFFVVIVYSAHYISQGSTHFYSNVLCKWKLIGELSSDFLHTSISA